MFFAVCFLKCSLKQSHLFNNTVATNVLHVVSLKGADELQIVRIMAAQIVSFVFVLTFYYYKNRNGNG